MRKARRPYEKVTGTNPVRAFSQSRNTPQNPFFIGREAEVAQFADLLMTKDDLTILNVYGHSSVGKTWLLEEFRNIIW